MSDIKGKELNMNKNLYLSLVRWFHVSWLALRLAKMMLEIFGTAINYRAIGDVKLHA
jgi:hypothetical protein